MRLAVSQRLGSYTIQGWLGAGGMGEVYRARGPEPATEVALKVLPETVAANPKALARLCREAKTLTTLSHPNVVACYEFGEEDGLAYAVFELLRGESLGARLRRGPMPWPEATAVARDVAGGLGAVHALGVLHRDVKPDNVFLTAEGTTKLLDFGLARIDRDLAPFDSQFETTEEALSLPGSVLGTLPYMSPEQARGDRVDPRSDIFSLGCVLYEMVYGARPFSGDSHADLLASILKDEPSWRSNHDVTVPGALVGVIAQCLSKDRRDRFASSVSLLDALDRVGRPSDDRNRAAAAPSIAVLPLTAPGDDAEVVFLTDGVTETLINILARRSDVRLLPRDRVYRWRERQLDSVEVGRSLGAEAVLTCSVARLRDVVRVQVDLMAVGRGRQGWGKRFIAKFEDQLADEHRIAREIACATDDLCARLRGAFA
jgi:serine/threonine protein kinase